MRIWHFSEQAYPEAWDKDPVSLRVTLPNHHFDPHIGADLLNRYLDEYAHCDEIGINIMVNEHHSTPTCLSASCTIPLAMLARATTNVRLLCLGIPLANRRDPVRVAEELSYIDLVSRGRLEMGFVRGIPSEISAVNSTPVDMSARLWEAHDLIIKAMTTHDGPFNWEGKYYHHRQVNIWPRPYQQPHPNVWTTANSPSSIDMAAEKGATVAAMVNGLRAKRLYSHYRDRLAKLGRPRPTLDRFAYMGLAAVAGSRAEALRRLDQVRGYLRSTVILGKGIGNPPGYIAPNLNAEIMRDPAKGEPGIVDRNGKPMIVRSASHEELIDAGAAFAGTPDEVLAQIKRFHHDVGGIGNLMIMAQGGDLSHKDTVDSLNLFAKEVLPQLANLKEPQGREFDREESLRENARRGGEAAISA